MRATRLELLARPLSTIILQQSQSLQTMSTLRIARFDLVGLGRVDDLFLAVAYSLACDCSCRVTCATSRAELRSHIVAGRAPNVRRTAGFPPRRRTSISSRFHGIGKLVPLPTSNTNAVAC